MCGISGGIGNPTIGDPSSMTNMLAHRGPDSCGVKVVCESGPVWLGHRRLSVIDRRSIASQPMWSYDKRYCLVFNGEIYNFEELRSCYCRDYPFVSRSDTEVLLAMWHAIGRRCIPLLRGMFAFAIYDAREMELSLCRDIVGVKPLYYANIGVKKFLFSSEVKSLVSSIGEYAVDRERIAEFLYYRYVPGENTMFAAIKRVPPATELIYSLSDGRIQFRKYWRPPEEKKRGNLEEVCEELDSHLQRSVSEQMIADVPLGVFLSGGLDSSLIASIARKRSSNQLKTFSIGFQETNVDESQNAYAVAKEIGTEHHAVRFRGTLRDNLPEVARFVDEPLADPALLPFFTLSKYARNSVVCVLSGDGADELFGGYKQYRFDRLVPLARPLSGPLRWVMSLSRGDERKDRLVRVLAARGRDHWPEWTGAASYETAQALTQGALKASIPVEGKIEDRLRDDLTDSLVCRMLMKVDKMSMAHALEVRVPYLDQHIVDFACSLEVRHKVSLCADKIVLRRIGTRHLSSSVFRRRKHGFNLPISDWLRGPDRDFCESELIQTESLSNWIDTEIVKKIALEHFSLRADHSLVLFSLLTLSLWKKSLLI